MSDGTASQGVDATPVPGAPAGSSATGLKAFLATTAGRVVVIGGALAVLAVIVAAVALIAMGTLLGGSSSETGGVNPAVPGTSPKPSGKVTALAPAVPPVDNREVFTPRDPFQRVVIPVSALATAGVEASEEADTLTLVEIINENGVRKGVFRFNGVTYTVGDGERLGDTSWQVVTVGTSSATMLFGDTQIVLTVGQGVQTK